MATVKERIENWLDTRAQKRIDTVELKMELARVKSQPLGKGLFSRFRAEANETASRERRFDLIRLQAEHQKWGEMSFGKKLFIELKNSFNEQIFFPKNQINELREEIVEAATARGDDEHPFVVAQKDADLAEYLGLDKEAFAKTRYVAPDETSFKYEKMIRFDDTEENKERNAYVDKYNEIVDRNNAGETLDLLRLPKDWRKSREDLIGIEANDKPHREMFSAEEPSVTHGKMPESEVERGLDSIDRANEYGTGVPPAETMKLPAEKLPMRSTLKGIHNEKAVKSSKNAPKVDKKMVNNAIGKKNLPKI